MVKPFCVNNNVSLFSQKSSKAQSIECPIECPINFPGLAKSMYFVWRLLSLTGNYHFQFEEQEHQIIKLVVLMKKLQVGLF